MLTKENVAAVIKYSIAFVWLVNGLWCKVLGQVPQHQAIVGSILGQEYAREITLCIGVAEIAMALWIITGYRRKINTWVQIAIISIMNILEFFLVPDLLLWGRFNALFALVLIVVIYCNANYIYPKAQQK